MAEMWIHCRNGDHANCSGDSNKCGCICHAAPAVESAPSDLDPRNWLIHGGGGLEDGEDGLRAMSVSGTGLIDFLESYRDFVLKSVLAAVAKKRQNG